MHDLNIAFGQKPPQFERRKQFLSPGIVINSTTPIADVTASIVHDGKLYLAGLDHVVRAYKIVDNGIDVNSVRTYRWPSWREERGAILAMDIAKDKDWLAIGGNGLRPGNVLVLDLKTGQVVQYFESVFQNAITSLRFDSVGGLWVGSARGGVAAVREGETRVICEERLEEDAVVQDLHCTEDRVICVFGNGSVVEFNVEQRRFTAEHNLMRAGRFHNSLVSADGRWIVQLQAEPDPR